MKLVIYTQTRENYGAHDWDGRGQCPQYWKAKGGEVYVVPGLTDRQAESAAAGGIPTLKSLIEYSGDGYQESVVDWRIAEDGLQVGESWESPATLHWECGRWIARRVTENSGQYRRPIAAKIEQYTMTPGGGQSDYSAVFRMADGELVDGTRLAAWFEALA